MVKKFLQNDLIHILGSDVHRENTIYKEMPKIINKLEKLIGKEKLKLLSEINPEKIINNEELQIVEPTEIKYTLIEKYIKNRW